MGPHQTPREPQGSSGAQLLSQPTLATRCHRHAYVGAAPRRRRCQLQARAPTWPMDTLSPTTAVSPMTTPVPWSSRMPWPSRAAGWMSIDKTCGMACGVSVSVRASSAELCFCKHVHAGRIYQQAARAVGAARRCPIARGREAAPR